MYDTLKDLTPVEDDSPAPKESLLREFIGGSREKGSPISRAAGAEAASEFT